jgi:hypothetical protein
LFVVEKQLFASGENKLLAAVGTLQKSVVELHRTFSHLAGSG